MTMILAILALMLQAVPVFACRMRTPLSEELLRSADVVFVGEAVEYVPSRLEKTGMRPALIRFKVRRMLRGAQRSEVSVYWVNGTFGESKSLKDFQREYGAATEVGVVFKDRCRQGQGACDEDFGGLAQPAPGRKLPWVQQGPCTAPYLRPVR